MIHGRESGTERTEEVKRPKRGLFGLDPLPEDRSIIVVSDLHLGGREDTNTSKRFCRFLDHLTTGSPVVYDTCSREGNIVSKRLLPPEKIILLGDILEVWDSRNRDRNCAFLDGLLPFLKLRDMDCDVVYVTGNHDEDIAEFVETYDEMRKQDKENQEGDLGTLQRILCHEPGEGDRSGSASHDFDILYSVDRAGRTRPESLKMRWRGARCLEISPRHFPAPRVTGGDLGLKAEGTSYAFIHGHQFDKEQIPYTLSRVVGRRFDPVDSIQDLASTSVTKKMGLLIPVANIFLFIALVWLYVNGSPDYSVITALFGIMTGIVLFLLFLAGVYYLGVKYRDYPSAFPLTVVCGAVAGALFGVLVAGWYQQLFLLLCFLSLLAFVFFSFPVIFAVVKRWAYTTMSGVRGKSPTELIQDKMFDPSKYQYKAEVLVFGHTHYADFESTLKPETVRLLVNAGSWVCEDANRETGDFDTFVYIDKTGICCLRWNDPLCRIECLCKEKGSPPVKVSLCDYIARNDVKLNKQGSS
jgi:UDP-2,3-diacylglucosamine pyrophosphatase LpxH/uncharacterized membrane protein (GlpM family)